MKPTFTIGIILLAFAADGFTAGARAEERKFAVLLAVPTKSVEGGVEGLDLPSPNDVWDHYFDQVKDVGENRVDSFAEYWEEISYGNVSVSGHVFGWVEVPWPVTPATHDDLDGHLWYTDLNGNGRLDQFEGETVPPSQLQAILIDYNGDADGTATPGYTEWWLDIPTPGLQDFNPITGDPVWTPGERFLDLDGDGRYDALLEGSMDGWTSTECQQDGIIQDDEACDFDADNQWDFPEPFEDFLVIYNPEATEPDNRWIKLDPSEKNLDPVSRTWAEAYIRANYPGDADALIARCGNNHFDGPDEWIESGAGPQEHPAWGSKLQQEAAGQSGGMWISGVLTPRPDDPNYYGPGGWDYSWSYDTWWQQYWRDKHLAAGYQEEDIPPAPSAPQWRSLIPNLQPFDPSDPSRGQVSDPTQIKAFNPNCGGTTARTGVTCAPWSEPSEDCGVGDPFDPNDPNTWGLLELDPQSYGDGSVDDSHSGGTTVLPDLLDVNADGVPDVYDGPAEFDDLPSSLYHARSASGLDYGGDGRLGEVTSVQNTAPYGHDLGSGSPENPGGPDGIIPAGGPLAYKVHGTSGYDAGNLLNLEYLTWRAQPSSRVPARPLGTSLVLKGDFNLDGLLDLGEVRDPNTENYCMDTNLVTPNDGGPFSEYPFNRRRMTEDVVAALDACVDWDKFVMVGADDVNYLHATIMIPPEAIPEGAESPSGRPLFVFPAPAMDLPIQIVDDPNACPLSPLMFSDYTCPLDSCGETGTDDGAGFMKLSIAHVWLHVWEGYPDLYDYDGYGGGASNYPVGLWDIMSGGFVHPCPHLKRFGPGSERLGTAHGPWTEITDLTAAMDPLVPSEITLTDYAFDPANSVYYFQNPDDSGERFYFWRITDRIPPNPDQVNFSRNAPGPGMLIMHSDFGDNPESLPPQQRIGTHFAYNIIQADGLQQLENGENLGDPNDPFPGGLGVTQWNAFTDPDSDWWGHVPSGIEIVDIVEYTDESVVTFYWHPREVPELTINRPPGYEVVDGNFEIAYEVWDRWGGTTIEFHYDLDNSGWDGQLVDAPPATKVPGLVYDIYPIPLSALEGDGTYYFYARLIPGPGQDGLIDPEHSVPRPSFANTGRGRVEDVLVNLNQSRFEQWTLTCVDHTVPGGEEWLVEGQLSGTQSQLAMTGVPFFTDDNELTFRIVSDAIVGLDAEVSNTGGVYTLTDSSAEFDPNDFKPDDVVRILEDGSGAYPGFYTIIDVPDAHTLQLADDPGNATGVRYSVHAFSTADYHGTPDRFLLMTTGKSAYSLPVTFLNGEVVPRVYPVITASYPDDVVNPRRRAPLRVLFDGSQSLDENAQPNEHLTCFWDFGDPNSPDPTSAEVIAEHVYDSSRFPGPEPVDVIVTLTVTNPNSGISTDETLTVTINPPCPGDLNGDDDVNLADLAQLLQGYGQTSGMTYYDGDLDGDGDIDIADLAELLGHYGSTCP